MPRLKPENVFRLTQSPSPLYCPIGISVITFLNITFLLFACCIAIPSAILLLQCLLAWLPIPITTHSSVQDPLPKTTILIPAHNEIATIETTIRSLLEELGPRDNIVVVADNCRDETASLARAAGATVLERNDSERRGKGYALTFGLDYLGQDDHNPEVVIIIDADCQISPGGIAILARETIARNRPLQADYILSLPSDPSPFHVISCLAFLVRNRVRCLGLRRLGLPCHLGGTGMAFPWKILQASKPTHDHLIEDRMMGIDMALKGHAPLYEPSVEIFSQLPDRDDAAMSQRRRWEHGQLASMFQVGPDLVARGIARLDLNLIVLGLDLIVPPLAFLAIVLVFSTVLAIPLFVLTRSTAALTLVLSSGVSLGMAILLSWLRYGRHLIPTRYIWSIIPYIWKKVPLYFAFLIGKRQRGWIRTERKAEENDAQDPKT